MVAVTHSAARDLERDSVHHHLQNRSEAMNLGTRILIVLAAACIVSSSAAETITYEYDELHRLIHVTYDDGAWIRYEYDAVGNRLLDVMNSTPGVGYLYATVEPAGSGSIQRDPNERLVRHGRDDRADADAA